jgi:hypothetical protein
LALIDESLVGQIESEKLFLNLLDILFSKIMLSLEKLQKLLPFCLLLPFDKMIEHDINLSKSKLEISLEPGDKVSFRGMRIGLGP